MTLRTGTKGFTLIEVMVAAAILSLGTVLIQGSLMKAVDVLNHARNVLKVQEWMQGKFWEAREQLLNPDNSDVPNGNGSFEDQARDFNWSLETQTAKGKDLYQVRLSVKWTEAGRPAELNRDLYMAINKQ